MVSHRGYYAYSFIINIVSKLYCDHIYIYIVICILEHFLQLLNIKLGFSARYIYSPA